MSHVVTVNFATADGTAATSNNNHVAAPRIVTFAVGQTSQTDNVTENGDKVQESDEAFSVLLSSPSGSNIADGSGIGTILDDDSGGDGGQGGGNGVGNGNGHMPCISVG
ncbi:MAG: hypothetical protein H6822_12005 [Planctomycetaceae bacterium]|nr:hypothetical protein [Planctomycetales bacterium]MCB9922900.1 hypothetical protein [Planctomycetaceae bacterium]